MTRIWILLAACSGVAVAADAPSFTADNQLNRPDNYREWVFLSAGLGMTYGPAAQGRPPMFENVFVKPQAYRAFLATGQWPDKTMFILEIRAAVSKGSINKGGSFQGDVVAVEAAGKDEARFPDKWAYFDLGRDGKSAAALPKTASCYACHSTNGAVENTFVQFYPTLLEVATRKGTLKESYLKSASSTGGAH